MKKASSFPFAFAFPLSLLPLYSKIINKLLMIQKHFNLSCYVIEQPFTTQYSSQQHQHIIDFIDTNNDIYEFKLSQPEIYEKIANQRTVKQLRRIGLLWFLLDTKGIFIVRSNANELYRFQKVEQIQILQLNHATILVIRTNQSYSRNEMNLNIGFIDHNFKNEDISINFQEKKLEESVAQQDHFQKYISQSESKRFTIQKLLGKCCLVSDNNGEKFIIRINIENFNPLEKIVKFQRLDFDLDAGLVAISSFKEKILVKKSEKIYLIDAQEQKIVEIKSLQTLPIHTTFIVYNNFIIILIENNLNIFQILKGNKMAEINIDTILQEFQEGSTIVFKEQPKKDIRYSLLFQQKKPKLTHFYLLDKEKLALYYFNVNKLLQRGFIKTIKESLQGLQNDNQKYHENIMKTMNFRIKKLQALQKYLLEDLKQYNFSNTIRFLLNEPTIYVLNDGLTLFYQTILTNIFKLTNNKQINAQLEKEFVRICYRLITESNYQNQIANGLQILNGVYTNFRKYQQVESLEKNKEAYAKLLETNRVTKLLKNDKKKRLFELSYELALKIKGYKYLQSLQSSKNK